MRIIDQGIDLLGRLGTEIFGAKTTIAQSISVSNDSLHLIAGVVLHLIAAFILRVSLRNFGPWLLVLGLALINELNDLHVGTQSLGTAQFGEGGKDIILIMLLPTLLLIVARKRPNLLAKRG